jgi:hypothetical protein
MKMDWRTRLDETRAPFNFYYLTLSGSGGDVDKVSIRNCRFRPRLAELRLQATGSVPFLAASNVGKIRKTRFADERPTITPVQCMW